jgi:hypothetical protein
VIKRQAKQAATGQGTEIDRIKVRDQRQRYQAVEPVAEADKKKKRQAKQAATGQGTEINRIEVRDQRQRYQAVEPIAKADRKEAAG